LSSYYFKNWDFHYGNLFLVTMEYGQMFSKGKNFFSKMQKSSKDGKLKKIYKFLRPKLSQNWWSTILVMRKSNLDCCLSFTTSHMHLNVMVPLEQAMERNSLLVVRPSSDCQVVSSTRRWLERSPRVEDCSSGCQMLDHASMQICKIASNW
jgi:hypothetical protein